jgi:hypothetical protein
LGFSLIDSAILWQSCRSTHTQKVSALEIADLLKLVAVVLWFSNQCIFKTVAPTAIACTQVHAMAVGATAYNGQGK